MSFEVASVIVGIAAGVLSLTVALKEFLRQRLREIEQPDKLEVTIRDLSGQTPPLTFNIDKAHSTDLLKTIVNIEEEVKNEQSQESSSSN
ncbi:MAG: hypothetical protein L0Y75_02030 [Acidobacteria bacterium]|nr:hypothetical protein [Acidobacteriota bacterium]